MSKVFDLIKKEQERQETTVELIASENFVSDEILSALGSVLTNKYTEGYPPERYKNRGRKGRYYGGCEYYDELEEYCCEQWRKAFRTDYHVNVQPHSGSQANMAAYAAFLKPGDTILAMSLDAGGHLTHSAPVSFVGNLYNVIPYGVDKDGILNYDEIEIKIINARPKLIVFGASAYSRKINFDFLFQVVKYACSRCHHTDGNFNYRPIIMVDMAHIAGLVAAGYHHSPFGFADVITTTTHKTLRGPRGGLIFCRPEYAEQIDKAVFPYCQGGSLMNVIAAKAICAEEAQTDEYKEYIQNVIHNSKAMAEEFYRLGYNIIAGGTDNHLFLLDLRGTNVTGRELQEACDEQGITLNKNAIPNDPLPPGEASGVRIGTAAMTTKGFSAADFEVTAQKIDKIIKKIQQQKNLVLQREFTNEITPDQIINIKIGEYDLDPDVYKDIEIYKNATVIISENTRTGDLVVSWKRQPDTEEVANEED